MARLFLLRGLIPTNLPGSILKKMLIVAACVVAFAQSPALAQRVGGHPGAGGRFGGGVRMSAPPRAPISQPRVFVPSREAGPRGVGPHPVGLGHLAGRGGFGFRQGPIRVFSGGALFGTPFFRFGRGWGFNSVWWPNCGPSLGWAWGWAWGWGYVCSPVPYSGYGLQNYVIPQTYENPVYLYGGGERDLIWLYLKDGTTYGVTDYWFVSGQMHFSMVEDDPTRAAEHVIPYDELDLQKTIYVNTRRGFRIVFRDEPWQQYLKDHPDLTPPDLTAPQGN